MSPNGFSGAAHMHIDTSQHSYRGVHRNGGGEERDSISSSDDGNYASYPDVMKYEVDLDDENTTLISQTLNTDGTPKRPMNAFMIFARRRRPQVSAENQAMRTGEISKILSKEWNAMPPAEKQFYQDQARQLKDTFNSKYPDYVYRRRPNHSRRPRRKQDGGDPQNSSSTSDDFGLDDSSESPTETRDIKGIDQFPNLHRSMSTGVTDHVDIPKFPLGSSRADYTYPSPQPPFHSNDLSTKPFGSSSLDIGPSTLPNISGTGGPLSTQGRSTSGYASESGSSNSWGLPPLRPHSSSSSSWVGGDAHRSYQSIPTSKSSQFASWTRPPSSLSTASSSSYGMSSLMGNEGIHDAQVPSSTASFSGNSMPASATYSSRHFDGYGHAVISTPSNTSGAYQNGSYRDTPQYLGRNSQELPSISNYSMHSNTHPGASHIHGLPMPLYFQC